MDSLTKSDVANTHHHRTAIVEGYPAKQSTRTKIRRYFHLMFQKGPTRPKIPDARLTSIEVLSLAKIAQDGEFTVLES